MAIKKCGECALRYSCKGTILELSCMKNNRSEWVLDDDYKATEWDLETAREDYRQEKIKTPSCIKCKFYKYKELPVPNLFNCNSSYRTVGYCDVKEACMPEYGDLSENCKYYTYKGEK